MVVPNGKLDPSVSWTEGDPTQCKSSFLPSHTHTERGEAKKSLLASGTGETFAESNSKILQGHPRAMSGHIDMFEWIQTVFHTDRPVDSHWGSSHLAETMK